VINAFRHQRFLHAGPLARGRFHRIVINAFRHQRFLHPTGAMMHDRVVE